MIDLDRTLVIAAEKTQAWAKLVTAALAKIEAMVGLMANQNAMAMARRELSEAVTAWIAALEVQQAIQSQRSPALLAQQKAATETKH